MPTFYPERSPSASGTIMGEQKANIAVVIDPETENNLVVLADFEQTEAKLVSLSVNRILRTALECCEAGLLEMDDCSEIENIAQRIARKNDPEIPDEALRTVLEVTPEQLSDEDSSDYINIHPRFLEACTTLVYFKDRRALEPLMQLLNTPTLPRLEFDFIAMVVRGIDNSIGLLSWKEFHKRFH